VVLASALCWASYSSSEVIIGQTGNAAINGLTWGMDSVLPDQGGLTINGIFHRYTINKDPNSDATVYLRNENALGEGYVYERNDVWDGLPGNTKVGYDPVLPIPREAMGQGKIGIDGDGTLSNVTVLYNYKYDTCYNPITDPSCPGYFASLYKYLLDNNLLNTNTDDPYYNEWVQAQLDREYPIGETEEEKKEAKEEEEVEEELDIEAALSVSGAAEEIADVAQQEAMLKALAALPKLDSYYSVAIQGGSYEETIKLKDAEIPDNTRALRNLASGETHRDMVRSQYDEN
jgi:hypothetical protein